MTGGLTTTVSDGDNQETMAKLINLDRDGGSCERLSPAGLVVDGLRYTNSAAKFWCSLADEIAEDYPDCSQAELSASIPVALKREHLFPVAALERDLERLAAMDFEAAIREALWELETLGPPSPVRIRLLAGENEALSRELPLQNVDAEIFPFLLVWPLRWARISEGLWNDELVEGSFQAEDRERAFLYDFPFTITGTHLSEGLYRRAISFRPSVRPA